MSQHLVSGSEIAENFQTVAVSRMFHSGAHFQCTQGQHQARFPVEGTPSYSTNPTDHYKVTISDLLSVIQIIDDFQSRRESDEGGGMKPGRVDLSSAMVAISELRDSERTELQYSSSLAHSTYGVQYLSHYLTAS